MRAKGRVRARTKVMVGGGECEGRVTGVDQCVDDGYGHDGGDSVRLK